MAQGKQWDRKKVIELLRPFLRLGLNITKACISVGISQSTVATWLENDEGLRLKFTSWQNEVNNLSRKVIVEKLRKGDVNLAKWWLERKESDEFGVAKSSNVEIPEKTEDDLSWVEELSSEQLEILRKLMTEGREKAKAKKAVV